MAKVAFIGLGNMGGPMTANLCKAQHHVVAFDLSDAAVAAAIEKGAHKAESAAEAVKDAEIVVTEGFMLAKRLGLDFQKLFDIASTSSGQSWALTNYCPVPGPVPTSPANRDYQAGFTAAMMLKDLLLAQQAANAVNASTPLGASAAQLFNMFVNSGHAGKDFSGIIRMLDGK